MTDEPEPGAAEIKALVEAIRPVKVAHGTAYAHVDRYRDFHRVFHGTPEGKRVLAQIIDLCEGPAIQDHELGNHAYLAARVAKRKVGTTILAWASVPPTIGEDR